MKRFLGLVIGACAAVACASLIGNHYEASPQAIQIAAFVCGFLFGGLGYMIGDSIDD